MEALAGQLAPTQPSPTQKQRQEQQAGQANHKQPAAEAAAVPKPLPPLQQRGKQPAAQQQAVAALLPPAALMRGADVQLEPEAELDVVFATDDVVPATEQEEVEYG